MKTCVKDCLSLAIFLLLLPWSSLASPAQTRIVVLGDSIAAGYGLSPEESFPSLLEQKALAAGYSVQVVNAGVGGDTTAGGARRIDWLLKQPIDILIIELGGNDALRGLPVDDSRKNLTTIIAKARARHPQLKILLAGMLAPPNLGQRYVEEFNKIYPALAAETQSTLIPFILEGVAGKAELNQPDGIHPTAEGQRKITATVWTYIQPLLPSSLNN